MRAGLSARTACKLALLGLLAGLTGCTPPRPLLETPLAPASAGQSTTARQLVTVHAHGQTHQLQVVLKLEPSRLTLIGLSPIGARAFTLTQTESRVQLTGQSTALERIDPKRVLSDLQLAYWPVAALRRALPAGLSLQQTGSVRLVWRGDELAWLAARATGEQWRAPITIYNARLGYRLRIRPLANSAAPAGDNPKPGGLR